MRRKARRLTEGRPITPACTTRTFVVPATTIERKDDADPSHGGAPVRPWPDRDGRRVHRHAQPVGAPRFVPRRLPRSAPPPRGGRARQHAPPPTAQPRPPSARRADRGPPPPRAPPA